MGKSEDVLKNLILSKYKSIRDFTIQANIPYTTVDSVLKRGVLKSNVDTVIKMCQFLGISTDALVNGEIRKSNVSCIEQPQNVPEMDYAQMNTILARNGKKLSPEEKQELIKVLLNDD